jgi:hypothetical protein
MSTATRDKQAKQYHESRTAKVMEKTTAKVPSDLFLYAAAGSIIGSAYLQIKGNKERSLFVGQWAPTFLVLGMYNKMVKLLGSE